MKNFKKYLGMFQIDEENKDLFTSILYSEKGLIFSEENENIKENFKCFIKEYS